MHGFKVVWSRCGHDAHQVDHGLSALDGASDRVWKAQIGLDGVDLPDFAQRLQMSCKLGPPYRDSHPPTIAG
jgi:hypothetical protein